jgi:hypothetical protein
MRFISSFLETHPFTWLPDWAWGTPLIVLTVVIHVLGLGVIKQKAFSVHSGIARRHHHTAASMVIIGAVTLSATFLHAMEAFLWAGAYVLLSALPAERDDKLWPHKSGVG